MQRYEFQSTNDIKDRAVFVPKAPVLQSGIMREGEQNRGPGAIFPSKFFFLLFVPKISLKLKLKYMFY